MRSKYIETEDHRMVLQVLVQPGSSKNGWGKILEGERIQLKITAAPVDGAANKACIKFLSKEFKAPKSGITIISGETSRYKKIEICSFDKKKLNQFMNIFL